MFEVMPMTHATRMQSEGNTYHIIVRGVGKQIIFEDDDDRSTFMNKLSTLCSECKIDILVWCLMTNHVHIIVNGELETISSMMMRLESSYAVHFNARHSRIGTLFQGRFTSVPITSDEQLCSAARYIHMNPVKAGGRLDERWSSYGEYVGQRSDCFARTDLLLSLLGGKEGFVKYHTLDDSYTTKLPRWRMSEDEALATARSVLGGIDIYDIRSLGKPERDSCLVKLREAGLTAAQIERLTSIGKNIIYRAK